MAAPTAVDSMNEKTRMIQAPCSVKPSATVSETVQRIAKTHASWRGAIEQLRFNIHSRVSIAPRHLNWVERVSLSIRSGIHWMRQSVLYGWLDLPDRGAIRGYPFCGFYLFLLFVLAICSCWNFLQ
ncbi:hypothetical protein [Herbaspirillum seropedicae]|uniref:hypothetical protein n=1 Tax=Herbaspirillum seropedicae TaxID=964 RepID=UPI002866107B|nr:hypothetical protein [Herbaspirillum seropedicae]MDR6396010.1 hypothetical protein [Herbaspirillum seropedicae]